MLWIFFLQTTMKSRPVVWWQSEHTKPEAIANLRIILLSIRPPEFLKLLKFVALARRYIDICNNMLYIIKDV